MFLSQHVRNQSYEAFDRAQLSGFATLRVSIELIAHLQGVCRQEQR